MDKTEDKRKRNIKNLELLAQEVLELKNLHRQRRPIVIEFCGSPKSGKTSSINSLNIFLKRNGFKTTVLTERASVCPISDKENPIFNVWTCSATINEINAETSKANLAEGTGPDIILCDRGIFDALCWFRWLKGRDKMDEAEYNTLSAFAMLNRWQRNIDLVCVFIAEPEESIKREYANLLTDKRGSIMREDILKEYRQAVLDTFDEYKESFRATFTIDTTHRDQNSVGYEVTKRTLQTLKEMLMEKIGFVEATCLRLKTGINQFSKIEDKLEHIQFGLRKDIEEQDECIQPIAIAVVLSKNGDKILCVKKTEKSTKAGSPEYGQTLLYVGGHMRKEDQSKDCHRFLDTLRNTLQREILEELGVSVAISKTESPFVIYNPEGKSQHHLAVGWVIHLDEETKLKLDSYELVQRKGKSKSGTFVPFSEILDIDIKLEMWSRTILLGILSENLSDNQKEILRRGDENQISLDDLKLVH